MVKEIYWIYTNNLEYQINIIFETIATSVITAKLKD